MRVLVEHVRGARRGERQEFADAERIRFGRHRECEVAFDAKLDLDASTRHAEIRLESDGAYLADLGSSNGTFIDGERVTRRRLRGGEVVEFGGPGGPAIRLAVEGAPVSRVVPAARRTMGDAVSRAWAVARGRGVVRSTTTFVRALVEETVQRSTRRLRWAVAALGVVAVVAAAAFAVQWWSASSREAELRRRLVTLVGKQGGANPEEALKLLDEIERLNRELGELRRGGGSIVDKNRRAVWMLAYQQRDGSEAGFCTAFAVGARVLATNAHCVAGLDDLRAKGARPFAVLNGERNDRLRIVKSWRSPRYAKGARITEDVGLVRVERDVPARVTLAPRAALEALQPGDLMYTYGFPGRLADPGSPEATIVQGVIGRVTRLDGSSGPPRDRRLIQHSAFTSGGTSGSPIFDVDGRVIALNAGGYVESGSVEVVDPKSGKKEEAIVQKPLPGYNFGLRADLVEEFLRSVGEGP